MKPEDKPETKLVEAYSLFEFMQLVQDSILSGYRLNADDPAKYPTMYGTYFVAVLDSTSASPAEPTALEPEDKPEDKPEEAPKKRQRKPKEDVPESPAE